jgi:hypothetical protein
MVSEELEEKFDAAAAALTETFKEFEVALGCPLSEVGEITFKRLIISYTPGIETLFTETGGVFYRVEENTAVFLGGAAQRFSEAHDIYREICASNIFEGAPLPKPMRSAAMLMVREQYPGAKRAGRKLDGDFLRKWLLVWAAEHARDAFGLKLTRYDGPQAMSACDVVSQVSERFGWEIDPIKLRDWCQHKKYAQTRRRAEAFTRFFKDRILHKSGAVQGDGHPFGPIGELALMQE